MMRKLILAVLAMASVGVAQAVTVEWSDKASLMTGGGSGTLPTGVSPTNFSMAFVLTLSAPPTDGFSLLTLTFGNNTNKSHAPYPVTLGFNSNGTLRFQVGSTNPLTPAPALTKGTHVIGLFVSHANNRQNIDVSVDGGAYTSLTYSCNSAWDTVSWSAYGAQYHVPGFVTNTWTTFADGQVTPADFAALPEPTALALLALGVAGVALRRKAA